jgi:hypothetical protein
MKMTTFWDIVPCSLAEVEGCFRCAYCLHHQGDVFECTEIFNDTFRKILSVKGGKRKLPILNISQYAY